MHRKILIQGLLAAAVAIAGTAYAADTEPVLEYVGVKTCKMCHSKQYAAWASTKHAKALATLKGADEKVVAAMAAKAKVEAKKGTDEACMSCHVTGLGTKSGFVASDTTKAALHGAVACEACHGPGSQHKAAAKDAKKATMAGHVSEKTCVKCHTPEMSPKFDYSAMKVKVHPVAAAK